MSKLYKQRPLRKFCFTPEGLIDLLGLLLISGFFISWLPLDVLNSLPATGGDMGSHFWPVHVLKNEGLPYLRLWNPGNLGGQPLFVRYFPLPFILMSLLGFFMDLGTAFNIGTLLPLLLLPLCVYFCMRQMSYTFPIPLLTAVFTLPFIYNESYSMFGGNTLSTLAGQFAHVYGLCFLFLGLGFLFKNIKQNRFSLMACLCFSATALSHAYVFVIVPVFLLILLLLTEKKWLFERFKILLMTGIVTLLLSAWFLWPLIDDSQWITPIPMFWGKNAIIETLSSRIFYPLYVVLLLWLISMIVALLRKQTLPVKWQPLCFWGLPLLAYLGMFFVFPKIGLVDCRTIPQMMLFLSVISGFLYALMQKMYLSKNISFVLTLPTVLLMMWLTSQHVHQFPNWSKWNYSGWQVKKYYTDLKQLYQSFPPGFSKPRVISEHNADLNGATGTPRVFEMLPYFASRSIMEGLYAEANLLSPTSHYLQAKVSKAPSCAIRGYICPSYGGEKLKAKLHLMGVESIIALTDEVKAKMREVTWLREGKTYGLWTLYDTTFSTSFLHPLSGTVEVIDRKDSWRKKMNEWFDQYDGQNHWQIVSTGTPVEKFKRAIEHNQQKDCDTDVQVDFFGFDLQTSCVGVPHIVTFAYNSSWKNSANDPIYLMAPGVIGLIPSQSQIRFDFGQSISWKISSILSFFTFFGGLFIPVVRRFTFPKAKDSTSV